MNVSDNRLVELRLWNFRAFRWACLPLADLTVIVGPNGSGKTTIAQALTIVTEGLNAGLEVALLHADGALSLRSRPVGNADRIGVAVKVRAAGCEWVYGFVLHFSSSDEYVIEEERLRPLSGGATDYGFWRRGSNVNTTVGTGVGELMSDATEGFLALPMIAGRRQEWTEVFSLLRRIRCYQLIPESIRSPHEAGSAAVPLSKDGSNAADVLNHLRDSRTKAWIVEHLAHTTSGVVDVLTKTFGTLRYLAVLQKVNGTIEEFGTHALSEGTVRMLGALLALRQEPKPSFVFLDEVDADLHPSSLPVLMDAITACLDDSQVMIATHSTEALDHESVTGDRVRLLSWAHGESRIHLLGENTKSLLRPSRSVGRLLSHNALWPDEPPLEIASSDDADKALKFLGGD